MSLYLKNAWRRWYIGMQVFSLTIFSHIIEPLIHEVSVQIIIKNIYIYTIYILFFCVISPFKINFRNKNLLFSHPHLIEHRRVGRYSRHYTCHHLLWEDGCIPGCLHVYISYDRYACVHRTVAGLFISLEPFRFSGRCIK